MPSVRRPTVGNKIIGSKVTPGAQTSIVQSLTYFEHLSEPMAEFLHILAEQYDYPQLSDEILKYIHVPLGMIL